MGGEEISTVSDATALLVSFFSIIPMLNLLSIKAIDSYRNYFYKYDWVRKWIEREVKIVPGPGVLIGFGFGVIAATLVALFAVEIIADYKGVLRPDSRISWTIQIAFLYAGILEEVIKCSFGLFASLILAKVSYKNTGEPANRENDRTVFHRSVPFICGSVGLGFSFIENWKYLEGIPTGNLAVMLIIRGLVSSSVHTAINFNFGLSLLQITKNNFSKIFIRALMLAVLFHGIFDFFALSPEPFPEFIATLILLLIIVITLKRMYVLLPETRYRFLQSTTDRSDLNAKENLNVSPGFILYFLRDPFGRLRSDGQIPLSEALHYPENNSLAQIMELEHYRGVVPDQFVTEWKLFEETYYNAFIKIGFQYKVWDSSVFAQLESDAYNILIKSGVDLTLIVPFRILEFKLDFTVRYIYISCGLRPLYGRELWLSFPHRYLPVRWFLLNLAQRDFIKEIKVFQPVKMGGDLPGAPYNRYSAFMGTPLFDPLRDHIRKACGKKNPLPFEIIYLSQGDLRFIEQYGIPDYFNTLKANRFLWGNNFQRPDL